MPVWISLTAYAVTYTTIIIIQNALLKKKSRRLAKALVDMQSRITAGADKRPMCANTLSERVALLSLNKFDGIHIAVENGLVLRIFMAGLVDLLALGRIKLTSVDDSTSDHAKVLISVVDTAATGNIALSLLLCKLRDRQQKAGDAPIDLARWLYTLLSNGHVVNTFVRAVYRQLATQAVCEPAKTYDVFKRHIICKRTALGVAVTERARSEVQQNTNIAAGVGSDGDLLARLVLSTYGSQSSTRTLFRRVFPLGKKPQPFQCTPIAPPTQAPPQQQKLIELEGF
eukprot:TRINITY_DN2648_c0_g2_i1.p1 TRINITY_DN2648_c0_g2~~TRINITY_DN2648_c0_g2_i1.p1  ORF type:complete len:299 (-),score=112.01 TRINITY_DN2648_c0_g2_i1:20-874(-)